MLKETVIDWSMTVWVSNIAGTYGHVSLTPVNDTKFMDICSQWQKFMAKPAKKCHWLWSMTKKSVIDWMYTIYGNSRLIQCLNVSDNAWYVVIGHLGQLFFKWGKILQEKCRMGHDIY